MILGRMAVCRAGCHAAVSFVGVVACAVCLCAVLCYVRCKAAGEGAPSKRSMLFGLSVFLFFFLFGFWRSASVWCGTMVDWPAEERVYRAVLTEVPRVSERAVTAEALVRDAGENRDGRLRKVSLSFLRDTLSEQLGVGDCLLFRGTVRRPVNRGNPDEFDFATYLAVKGISGQVFLLPANWSPAETDGASDMLLPWTARMRVGALKWRGRMLARYRQSGLHGTEYALFAAVTLGEKSGLSHGMRSLYAETGVSHVLALSGMHLGLLMMLFNFVFVRCVRRKVLRTFVGIAALLLMWVYVFVAGLPASLVRAAFMYTMMWGAVMCGRKGFSVNALSACAFVMVCISPMYLYDTGFQLSFLAMAGILTVYPFWQNLKIMRLPVAGWLFRSLWLSFSAQLFTLPLVAYCFGLFSLSLHG